ncbi:MAG: phenylalanine--tRNA ligase subunit beta, partial [Nocardioides sp.]
GRAADWSDALEAVRTVAAEVGVEVSVEAVTRQPWHPSRCGRVLAGDTVLGHAGELHPGVCRRFGLPRGTSALEIDLDVLMARAVDSPRAPSYSNQPVAKEDVSLVVDESVAAAAVEAALRSGAGDLLESVRLFDVYTGPQVGEGRKSLAFALRFRATDRTLTESEAAAARDAAVAAAASAVGAVQR